MEQTVSENTAAQRGKTVLKKTKFKLFSIRSGIDMPFLCILLLLLAIGLITMFSASYAYGYYQFGDSYKFIRNQGLFAAIGIVVMLLVSFVDYHVLHKFAWPILLIAWILLVIVLFMPAINYVHRWIQIPGLGNFQPSEIAKFALILICAHMISVNYKKMRSFVTGILPYLIILGITGLLVYKEPHISALVIMILLTGVMLFVGGVKLRWFGIVIAAIGAGLGYLVLFASDVAYASNRIQAWLNPFSNATQQLIDDTWQTRQSLYAIGSGGWLGVGLGQSRQKYLWLPEPQNDYIFAIVCEEMGWIFAVAVIFLFVLLLWRGLHIARNAPDQFSSLVATGIIIQIALQVFLNIGVVTNSLPSTGVSLPFFSYGGSSLIIFMAEMGVILNISKQSTIEKT